MTCVRSVGAAFPEAWPLCKVHWQFFVKLLFRAGPPCSLSRRKYHGRLYLDRGAIARFEKAASNGGLSQVHKTPPGKEGKK